MEIARRRPFKVSNSQRTKLKGIVVSNIDELIVNGCRALGIQSSSCRVFIDKDGTEIEDDEYFSFIEEQTKLMLVEDGENWSAIDEVSSSFVLGSMPVNASLESNESLDMDLTDASMPISELMVHQIKKNPLFFVSFSSEDLQTVIDCDLKTLALILGLQEQETKHYQETCQRELDKRTEMREASELLKLYDKVVRQQPTGSSSEPERKKIKT